MEILENVKKKNAFRIAKRKQSDWGIKKGILKGILNGHYFMTKLLKPMPMPLRSSSFRVWIARPFSLAYPWKAAFSLFISHQREPLTTDIDENRVFERLFPRRSLLKHFFVRENTAGDAAHNRVCSVGRQSPEYKFYYLPQPSPWGRSKSHPFSSRATRRRLQGLGHSLPLNRLMGHLILVMETSTFSSQSQQGKW